MITNIIEPKGEPVSPAPTIIAEAAPEDAVLHHLETLERAAKNLRAAFGPLRERVLTGRGLEAAHQLLLDQNAALHGQLDQALADQGEIWSLAGTGTDSALAEENAALHTKVGDQARQIAALLREVDRLRKGAE